MDTVLSNTAVRRPQPDGSLRRNRNPDEGAMNEVIDVYSLYETIMDDDSDLPEGFQQASSHGRRRGRCRTIRPVESGNQKQPGGHCCHNVCKCMKCSFLIAFVLIICVGLLVILPLKIIFTEDRISYNF